MGQQGGEYEPRDSRNVTGTSTNQTGDRWSKKAAEGMTPNAAGEPSQAGSGLAQARPGLANPFGQPGEPAGSAQRSEDMSGAPRDDLAPRDDSRREMMNSQENNQAPTPAQNQHHDATGEQPDGTFGQREDPSHGGFASSQQDMSEVSSQGEAGMGQHMGGQNSANNAGQAGYAGQQQQGATGGMDAGYDSGRPTSGGQQQQGSGQSALGSQSNIGASGSSQAGLSSIGQAGSGQSGQSGLGQSGSGMSASGQAGYNAGQQSQFDAGDSGQFRDQLREQMEVVDANGEHCGTIDSIDGDRIKLTRSDSTDGQHHYVEMSQVAGIESGQVRLNSNSRSGDADSNAPDNWNG